MNKTLQEVEEIYNLELERIENEIKRNRGRRVLLQFPDGMKPYSIAIAERLREKTKAEIFIWMGSCFGACDTPAIDEREFDLFIQFGHTEWKK